MDYSLGFTRLQTYLEDQAPDQLAVLATLRDRFWRNQKRECDFGITSETKNEHAQIIYALNELTLECAADSFDDLCGGAGENTQDVTPYITKPSPLQTILQDIGKLFQHNRSLIGLTLALQIPLIGLFFAFRDRLMLSDWAYLIVAILMALASWRWLKLMREGRTARSLLLACLVTAGWIGLLSQQTWSATHPARFSDQQFGIAVATFGEGASNRPSGLSMEITRQLLDALGEVIKQEFGRLPVRKIATRDVATTRIGVVQNETQAIEEGERVGAELVLWGKILEEKTGSEIHFQVLEAPDITDNPSFPQTLLVETNMRSQIVLTGTNPVQIRDAVSRQNATIVRYSIGLYYYLNLEFESAVDQFKLALDNAKPSSGGINLIDPAIIHYYLGKSYQYLERYEEAQRAFTEAAKLNPKEPAIALAQAYNYRVMGLEEERQRALQLAIDLCDELPSNSLPAIYDRALAYEQQENLEAALREYETILRARPDFFIAYLGSARLLGRLGRFEEAMARYQQAQPLAAGQIRKQVWLALDMGSLYEEKGQKDEALRRYGQAITLDPALSMPYYRRAQLYETLGMNEDALQDYSALAQISSQPHWAHRTFAEYLYRTKNYPASIDQFLEALRYPVYSDAMTHTGLGRAYAASSIDDVPDREQRARAQFDQALRSPGPNESYIRSEYGVALAGFGLSEEAIEQFERSLQLNEYTDPVTMLNLGQMYEGVENPGAARGMYEKILALEGKIADKWFNLALERLANLEERERQNHEGQSSP